MASTPPHWSIFTATTGNHRQTRQQSNNRQWLPPRVSSSHRGSHSLSTAPPSSPSPVSHRKLPNFSPLLTPNSSPPLSSDFLGRRSTRFVSKMHFNRPKTTTSTRHTPADVLQSTDQYMEPAQHGVQDVHNISTEVHVFHRTGQTDRAVYWTVPHASGKEFWLEPWSDDRSSRTGACLSRPTSHFKTYGRARIHFVRAGRSDIYLGE
ncbi:unnamed protein product, partial [Brassica oleracea]